MRALSSRRNAARLFESRSGRLDYRVRRDYVRNGVVSIPCRVSGYEDAISPYSVEVLHDARVHALLRGHREERMAQVMESPAA